MGKALPCELKSVVAGCGERTPICRAPSTLVVSISCAS